MVVELKGIIGTGAGVYLKGSYEAIKSAYDAQNNAFSMLGVQPKDEEEGEPALAVQIIPSELVLQGNLSFQYIAGAYTYYFNPDNTISAVRGGSQ